MRRGFSVAVYGAKRTPIGSFLGKLNRVPGCLLGAHALAAALTQAKASSLDEVIFGTVLAAGQGANPARQAALAAGLPDTTVATTISKGECSGLKSVTLAAETALLHPGRLLGAGGFESSSFAPHLVQQYREGCILGSADVCDVITHDGLNCTTFQVPIGVVAEKTAVKFDILRVQQDRYAKESLIRVLGAWDRGFYATEVAKMELVDEQGKQGIMRQDEYPFQVKLEEIQQILALYIDIGSVTAANSGMPADGGAALVLGLGNVNVDSPPLANLLAWTDVSLEPEWYPLSPVEAINKLLRETGFPREKVDLFEVSDSVAIAPLVAQVKLSIHPFKLNVNGGSISLGHPIGMTGTRMLCSLIYALKERQLKYGLVATCEGGGGATAVLVEVLS